MKILYLVRSLLNSRVKHNILAFISFTFVIILFNVIISSTYEYFTDMAYVSKNRYEDRIAFIKIETSAPPTYELVASQLSSAQLQCGWEYHPSFCRTPLYPEGFDPNSVEGVNEYMYYENLSKKSIGMISGYTTEYSSYIDVVLEGEKPDPAKDYEGKLPVIADHTSSLRIGQSAVYCIGEKEIEIYVTGKYASDNLRRYVFSDVSFGSEAFFTDCEIMNKHGIEATPISYQSDSGEAEYISYIILLNNNNLYRPQFEAEIQKLCDFSQDTRMTAVGSNAVMTADYIEVKHRSMFLLLPLYITVIVIGVLGIIGNSFIGTDNKARCIAVCRLSGAKRGTVSLALSICSFIQTGASVVCALFVCYTVDSLFGEQVKSAMGIDVFSQQSMVLSLLLLLSLSIVTTVCEIIMLSRVEPLKRLSVQ